MNSEVKSNRLQWADAARGIAILLVLFGHTCPPPYTTAFIYAFHMPLFFFLSGLFMSYDTPWKTWWQKRVRTLLVPFVIFNLVLLVSDWCIVAFSPNVHAPVDIPGRLLGTLTGWRSAAWPLFQGTPIHSWASSLWFLPALFVAQLLVKSGLQRPSACPSPDPSPVREGRKVTSGGTSACPSPDPSPVREGREVTTDGTQSPLPNRGGVGGGAAGSAWSAWSAGGATWVYYCLLSLAGIFYAHYVGLALPMSLDAALVATAFLLIGREWLRRGFGGFPMWYWVVVAIVFVVTTLQNFDYLGGGDHHVDMSTNTYGLTFNFYIAATAGSLLLVRACQKWEGACGTLTKPFRAACWLGRNSLCIYCLHRIPMNLGIAIWNALTPHLSIFNSQFSILNSQFSILNSQFSTLTRSFALLIFTVLLLIPAVYIVNRWFPWTLGKKSNNTK